MKAEAKSLRFLGEGKGLTVPFFQRNYVWNSGNWLELIQTFERKDVMPFLGSIILKEDGHSATIIDGQQRLTTITILAKAIFDSLPSDSKQPGSGIRNGIENFLFYRDNAADDFKDSHVRIEHSKLDRKDYSEVISATLLNGVQEIDLDTINENSSNILQCYKYFREHLSSKNEQELKDLFSALFNENRRVFVLIELQHNDINEQTIFDTINRAGMRLSTADIIKNNLFKHLLDACGDDEIRKDQVSQEYKECWEDVFYPSLAVSDGWDKKRVFGNVEHSNLEFLLYCVACIKWGDDSDMFKKLEEVFEKSTKQMTYSELVSLVKEIKDYALIYKKYILDFASVLEDEEQHEYFLYTEGVRRLLLILQKFGVQMFYPYVIMRLKDVNQDCNNQQLLDDFLVLESFVMRRKISSKGTHDYTSKCHQLIKQGITALKSSEFGADSGISNSDVREYLSSTKDETAKMILFWFELYRRRDDVSADVRALEYRYTLEHIMPQKWQKTWSDVPIVSNRGNYATDTEEGIAIRKSAIQSLGNKTLLTGSLNASVRNGAFLDKINGKGEKKPGYKESTTLSVTKEIIEYAKHNSVWDEHSIFDRQKRLTDLFITLWPSFAQEPVPSDDSDTMSDSMLDGFTEEQFDDPIKLIDAIH